MMSPPTKSNGTHDQLRHFPLTYSNESSEKSALTLIYSLRPEWEHSEGPIEIVRFKDGITNTVGSCQCIFMKNETEALDSFSKLSKNYRESQLSS